MAGNDNSGETRSSKQQYRLTAKGRELQVRLGQAE